MLSASLNKIFPSCLLFFSLSSVCRWWAATWIYTLIWCLFLFSCLCPLKVQAQCLGHTSQLSGMSDYDSELEGFASLLLMKDKRVVVPALHLLTRSLKPLSGLEQVARWEPSTYQPTDWLLSHYTIRVTALCYMFYELLGHVDLSVVDYYTLKGNPYSSHILLINSSMPWVLIGVVQNVTHTERFSQDENIVFILIWTVTTNLTCKCSLGSRCIIFHCCDFVLKVSLLITGNRETTPLTSTQSLLTGK